MEVVIIARLLGCILAVPTTWDTAKHGPWTMDWTGLDCIGLKIEQLV